MNLITFTLALMFGYVVGFVFDDHPLALMLGTLACGLCGMVAWSLVS